MNGEREGKFSLEGAVLRRFVDTPMGAVDMEVSTPTECQLQEILDKLPTPFVVLDHWGNILRTNPAFNELDENPSDIKVIMQTLTDPSIPTPMGFYVTQLEAILEGSVIPNSITVRSPESGNWFEIDTSFLEESCKASFLVIIRDITDQQNSIEQLKAANEELNEKYQALQEEMEGKQENMAMTTHDFRGDNFVVKGNVELIQKILLSQEQLDPNLMNRLMESLRDMAYASEMINARINNVVYDYRASIESEKQVICVDEIINEVFYANKNLMKLTGIEAELNIRNHGLLVEGNPHELRKLFNIFPENARHALEQVQDRRTFVITCVKTNNHTVVSFMDNGVGIPGENQEIIFKDYSTKRSSGQGTGSGLQWAKETAQSYGGDIQVRSATEEMVRQNPELGPRGSTFTVSLPLCPEYPED